MGRDESGGHGRGLREKVESIRAVWEEHEKKKRASERECVSLLTLPTSSTFLPTKPGSMAAETRGRASEVSMMGREREGERGR